MIDVIYKEIEAAIRALDAKLAVHALGPVKYIAPYLGQYQNPAKSNAIATPAVFIEPASIAWEDYNAYGQSGKMQINLHIVMKAFADGNEKSRDQAKFLLLYEYPSLINKELQGLKGSSFTGLIRRADVTDVVPDALYVHIISYETIVQELGTSRKNKKYVMTEQDSGDISIGEILV